MVVCPCCCRCHLRLCCLSLLLHNSLRCPPGPRRPPPPPQKPQPPLARPVEAYTTAPAPVWVEFDVSGTYKPLVLSIVPRTGPKNGTLGTIDQRGQRVRYTPGPKYCSLSGRADIFEYMVKDTKGKTSKARAKVFVDCPDAVTTEDQFVTTEINTPIDVSSVCFHPDCAAYGCSVR
jgi:hypothetical protein